MQTKTFKAKDAQGNEYTITCTREHVGNTNQWGVWDCYTADGKKASPVQGSPDQFQIIDIGEPVVTSLKPNPLK